MPELTLSPGSLELGGRPAVLLCSSVFPFRLPADQWAHRLRRVRESGYRMVDLYVHWGFHEEVEGCIDLSSPDRDLARFLDLAAAEDLLVMARPGPYICSETDGGGLPWWLHGRGLALRSTDPGYLAAVDRWFAAVLPVLAAAQTTRGGPVALVQIENELDFFDCPDPTAYQEHLAASAREHGIEVPIIACAGQGDLSGAGGDVPGVVPTMNLYPSDASTAFDEEARAGYEELAARGLPLLVTETNRLHRTLRREILAGARLVAPYLQTSGFNHLLLPSAGNWGDPGNLMTHDYDFGGYMSPDGRRRPEYDEAVRLARTLEAWGERLATARPVPLAEAGVAGIDAGGALALPGGGHVIGPAEVHGTDATVRIGAHAARVPASTCPFWSVQVPLEPWGAEASLVLATAELVDVVRAEAAGGPLTLLLEGPADARVVLATAQGELVVDGHGEAEAGGVRIVLRPVPAGAADAEPVLCRAALEVGPAAEPTEAPGTEHPLPADGAVPATEALGLRDGRLRADLAIPAGARELLLLGAADLVRVIVDGAEQGTAVPHGAPLSVPLGPATAHEVTVITETWGRANFDDARRPALALGAGRGLGAVHVVTAATDVTELWRVRRIPDARGARGDRAQPPIRPLGGWSSPRLGEDAVYVRRLDRPEEGNALLRLVGLTRPVHVSLDGGAEVLLSPEAPVLDLGAGGSVEVAIRAPHVPDGFVSRAELLAAVPPSLRGLRTVDRGAITAQIADPAPLVAATAPVRIAAGRPVHVRAWTPRSPAVGVQLQLMGADVQVTVVAAGRPVSRHVLGSPAVAGGDAHRSWVPASYLGEDVSHVELLVEALSPQGGIFEGASWSDAIS
ncbi:beta-galactosidase [Brachybacterium hainanense]|uniref:Beta-galactosidase n=1 Tax=Brachybacterium hainanense TaxID=1541174 RepID=A0ABV6R6R5_9MICO